MIIDSHAHIFPNLNGPSGYADKDEQLMRTQFSMSRHDVMPVRRKRDGTIITAPTLWDPQDPTLKGRWDTKFHAGAMGRMEWTYEGEDYYIQLMPPSLQDNTAPPELLLAAMDLAGVDRAVLQFGYGNVNDYFAEAVRKYPDRFCGMGGPREDTQDPAARAEHVAYLVEECGLRGIFYRNAFFSGPVPYEEPSHDVLWREVARLDAPVWWTIGGKDYRAVWWQFTRWCDRHPGIRSVMVMGAPIDVMMEKGQVHLPDYIAETVARHPVYIEICYAIASGIWEEYPFVQTNRIVQELYYKLGPHKLVWGSDFPNIERLCTYAQSLNHVRNHCPFISAADMQLILGENLAWLFK